MEEQAALDRFIKIVTQQNYYSDIPSASAHRKKAADIINSILISHPEYHPTLSSLVSYPVQSWAMKTRKELGIDTAILHLIMNEEIDPFYLGFITIYSLGKQTVNLENTDMIVDTVTGIFQDSFISEKEMGTLKALHYPESGDVTKYQFLSTYENALLKTCRKYNREISKIDTAIRADEEKGLNDEMKVVYHNAGILSEFIPVMRRTRMLRSSSVDFEEAVVALERCVEALRTYPINGEELYEVLSLWIRGYSDNKISKTIGRSRMYVSARKEKGLEALAALLWGYTI